MEHKIQELHKDVFTSVISVLAFSSFCAIVSIFDRSWLPLAFYSWIIFPILLLIDLVFLLEV